MSKTTFRVGLDPTKWHMLKVAGEAPTGRANHRAVAVEGTMYVFGDHKMADHELYAFNAAFSQWRKVAVAGDVRPRATRGASLCVVSNTLVMFGGETDHGISNDLHAFSVERRTWRKLEAKGPLLGGATGYTAVTQRLVPRRDHSAVVYDDRMYVFGGFSVRKEAADLIAWEARSGEWSAVTTTGQPPKKRGGHVCALYGHYMVIFGGMRHDEFLNDLHVFNIVTGVWTGIAQTVAPGYSVPQPRAFAAACVIDHTLYVHGGGDAEHLFADFHRMDLGPVARRADGTVTGPLDAPTVHHHNPVWDLIV